jgi:hypothetical protein
MNTGTDIRNGLFFIVGHHRGGTTLLQSMLNTHSQITIPPETQYFLEVWPRRGRLGDLGETAARKRVANFLRSQDCAMRDLKLDFDEVLTSLGSNPDYADLFAVVLTAWAKSRGKPHVGDKSPGHINFVTVIAELFPQAKFITSLRDPRAVVNSELNAKWGARSVDQIARRWRRVVNRHFELERALSSDRYLMLRYEDLIRQPEENLRRICAFLGESFETAMLRYYERPATELGFDQSESWKLDTLKPLDPGRLDAWKDSLTAKQVDLIERVAAPHMELLGYVPASIERPGFMGAFWNRFIDRIPWALEVATGAARRKRGPRRLRRTNGDGGKSSENRS